MQSDRNTLQAPPAPAGGASLRESAFPAISEPMKGAFILSQMLPLFGRLGPVGRFSWLRASLGAFCALAIASVICRMWADGPGAILLIGSAGASALLLFTFPASPLAQPWAVIGGNILSAVAGIACARLIPDPIFAGALAVAAAIAVMSFTRCLHPPGGATALTAVIGGPAVAAAGWSFVLMPVALNAILLVGVALLFNNLTRQRYPHWARPPAPNVHGSADPAPQERVGHTAADIDSVLARYPQLLDINRDDLEELFREVEGRVFRRLHGGVRCAQLMSRDVIHASPQEGVGQARDRLLRHRLHAMPVLTGDRRLVGIVSHGELLAGAGRSVSEVMDKSPYRVSPDTLIDELLPALSSGRFHEAIVVSPDGHLLGLITQTDLLAALWRDRVTEEVAAA